MGLLDFLNRHRNKILLLGGAAGTLMMVNKLLTNYEKQWQTSSSRGFVHEARKKDIHFENIIDQCNQLCLRMYPKINNRLQEQLDDTQLIDDLTSKREDKKVKDKVEIWKLLKVKLLTKLLGEIYSTCILVCNMRVQMSIIGGQLFAKSDNADFSGSSSASVADMKAYTIFHRIILDLLYDEKVDFLIQPIENAVEETLREYSIDYKICIQDFKVILDKIKRSISFFLLSPSSKTMASIAHKLSTVDLTSVCIESGPLTESDEQMLRKMLAETQDILESDDFKHVLESSIEVGYVLLLDTLLGAFIKMESKLNSKDESSSFSNPNAIQVPLVKILPQIRNNYLKRSEADQRTLVNHLLSLDVLNCFAANIYEAFCVMK